MKGNHKRTLMMLISMAGVILFGENGEAGHIPGDINEDGKVDFSDFLILAQNFGRSGDPGSHTSGSQIDTVRVEPLNQRGFPLAIGNNWKYQLTYIENWPDTLETSHFDVKWEVEDQEEVFGVSAFRVKAMQFIRTIRDTDRNGYTSYTWLLSSPESLKGVASQSPPPFAEGQLFKPATSAFSENPSPWQFNILLFPLAPGKSWPALDQSPGLATKTVVGRETVSVPAGSFETYKVKYVITGSPESFTVIWYGAVGIVKIVYLQPPRTIGIERSNHSLRVYELVSYRLN